VSTPGTVRRRARVRVEPRDLRERWVVSYADFITLLFAFFVVMYAISTVDTRKFERVSVGMKDAFVAGPRGGQPILLDLLMPGGAGGRAPEALADHAPTAHEAGARTPQWAAVRDGLEGSLGRVLSPEVRSRALRMEATPRGFVVSLSAGHLFEPGSDHFAPDAAALLDGIGSVLSTVHAPVRFEGHTDDTPVRSGRFASNWELSAARATRVLQYLIQRHDLRPERLSVAGYGPHRPLVANDSAEARARNRRVDVVLVADPLAGYEPPGPDGELTRLLDRLPPVHDRPDN